MKLLVVVDMQNDFVTGSLGSPQAAAAAPRVAEKIRKARSEGAEVAFTMDTHGADYLATQEGRRLPVPHTVKGTPGWELCPEVRAAAEGMDCRVFEKGAFGSPELAAYLRERGFHEVELVGVCTDICVISNAMLAKAFLPEARVAVDASCCAGVTPEAHSTALASMKSVQIDVL